MKLHYKKVHIKTLSDICCEITWEVMRILTWLILTKTLMENYLLNFSVISRSIAKIFLVELSKRKLLYSQNELFNYETVEWIIQSRKITELLSSRGHGHSIDAWSNITRVQHESFYKITPVAKNKFIKIYWEKNSLNFHQK